MTDNNLIQLSDYLPKSDSQEVLAALCDAICSELALRTSEILQIDLIIQEVNQGKEFDPSLPLLEILKAAHKTKLTGPLLNQMDLLLHCFVYSYAGNTWAVFSNFFCLVKVVCINS